MVRDREAGLFKLIERCHSRTLYTRLGTLNPSCDFNPIGLTNWLDINQPIRCGYNLIGLTNRLDV